MGSESNLVFIIVLAPEANGDNLGMSFRSSIKKKKNTY